jgi:hypothetical protein
MPCSPCHVGDNMLGPLTKEMPGACGSVKMKIVNPPAEGKGGAMMGGTVTSETAWIDAHQYCVDPYHNTCVAETN